MAYRSLFCSHFLVPTALHIYLINPPTRAQSSPCSSEVKEFVWRKRSHSSYLSNLEMEAWTI